MVNEEGFSGVISESQWLNKLEKKKNDCFHRFDTGVGNCLSRKVLYSLNIRETYRVLFERFLSF